MHELLMVMGGGKAEFESTTKLVSPEFNIVGVASVLFPSEDGQSFYLAGGYDNISAANRAFLRYDLATGEWIQLAPMTTTESMFYPISAEVANNKIVVWRSGQTCIYDKLTNTWSNIATPAKKTALDQSTGRGALYQGKLLSVGYGSDYTKGTGLNQYDPSTGVHSRISSILPLTRLLNQEGCTILGDYLYSAGTDNYIRRFNLVTNVWDTILIPMGDYSGFNLVTYQDKIYFMGGGADNKVVWYYDPATGGFGILEGTEFAINGFSCAAAGPDGIYVISNKRVLPSNKQVPIFYKYVPK